MQMPRSISEKFPDKKMRAYVLILFHDGGWFVTATDLPPVVFLHINEHITREVRAFGRQDIMKREQEGVRSQFLVFQPTVFLEIFTASALAAFVLYYADNICTYDEAK